MNKYTSIAGLVACTALSALGAGQAFAQTSASNAAANYPNRPVRLVVGMPAGGATDVLARVLGEKLGASMGQSFVVDNKPCAAGIIGTDAVAKAAPDGYTISVILSAAVVSNQFLYKLPYNPDKDFTYVAKLVDAAVVLATSAKAPYNTAKEFADYAKANPGKVTYGSYSAGSYGHVALAYLDERLKSQMTHVAYKGEPPQNQGLLGGEVDVVFGSVINVDPHVKAGKLKYLGVSGPKRMSALPSVPTLAEQGLTDPPFKIFGWIGMIAPAGVPQPIVDKLSAEISKAMKDPAVQERVRGMGFEAVTDSTPEKTLARYKADVPVWKQSIETAGVKVQ